MNLLEFLKHTESQILKLESDSITVDDFTKDFWDKQNNGEHPKKLGKFYNLYMEIFYISDSVIPEIYIKEHPDDTDFGLDEILPNQFKTNLFKLKPQIVLAIKDIESQENKSNEDSI